MATLALVNQQAFVDTETGVVTLEWTSGIPRDHPDPVNWQPDIRVELVLPGVAVITPIAVPTEVPDPEIRTEV